MSAIIFGDQAVAAAAMIDPIVHHSYVLTLKGASYRLRRRGVDRLLSIRIATDDNQASTHQTVHSSSVESDLNSNVADSGPSCLDAT